MNYICTLSIKLKTFKTKIMTKKLFFTTILLLSISFGFSQTKEELQAQKAEKQAEADAAQAEANALQAQIDALTRLESWCFWCYWWKPFQF